MVRDVLPGAALVTMRTFMFWRIALVLRRRRSRRLEARRQVHRFLRSLLKRARLAALHAAIRHLSLGVAEAQEKGTRTHRLQRLGRRCIMCDGSLRHSGLDTRCLPRSALSWSLTPLWPKRLLGLEEALERRQRPAEPYAIEPGPLRSGSRYR